MQPHTPVIRRWAGFAIVSAFFFLITAGTFSSLGVVLPYMIEEFSWSWSQAGIGFSLFALMVGLAGTAPAWTLSRFGTQTCFGIGGLLMLTGFSLLALAPGLPQYYVAVLFLGVGYALCAAVPGIHIINHWLPDRRSFAIGAYMMIGGLGAVAGPLMVTGIIALTDSWRLHWWVMAAGIGFLSVLALLFVRDRSVSDTAQAGDSGESAAEEQRSERVYTTGTDWTFGEALRTPQYYVIVFALTATLMCTLTMNSWAFTHMTSLNIPAAFAAGALAANGAVNAMSRLLGGALATRIDPKWLLFGALCCEAVGMIALSMASNPVMIALFVLGEGIGFGMVFFATAMLLVNYFGTTHNPIIFGTMNTITTFAMVGPVLAGLMAESLGSFAYTYQVFAVLLIVMAIAVGSMRPPRRRVPSDPVSVEPSGDNAAT